MRSLLWVLTLVSLLISTPAPAATLQGGVRVRVTQAPLAGIPIDLLNEAGQVLGAFVAASTADGSWSMSGVPAGNYLVRANPTASQGWVDQYHPDAFLLSAAQTVTVISSGATVSGLDFELDPGWNITGSIRDSQSQLPVSGIDLDIYEETTQELLWGVDADTDGLGGFVLGALPPGRYLLRADPDPAGFYVRQYWSGQSTPASANFVEILAAHVAGIDFDLVLGGRLSGVVRNTSGSGIAGLDLDVFATDPMVPGPLTSVPEGDAITAVGGFYTTGNFPPGFYKVRVDPEIEQGFAVTWYPGEASSTTAQILQVDPGVELSGLDFSLAPARFIEGVVTGPGGSQVADIDLDILDGSGVTLPQFDSRTDGNGDFCVGPLPPGIYRLRVDPEVDSGLVDEYYPGVFHPAEAANIDLTVTTALADVSLELEPGAHIQGHVTSQIGRALIGVDLDVYTLDGTSLPSVDGVTDTSGFYRVGALPAGSYFLRVDPIGYAPEYHFQSSTLAGATPIPVGAPGTVVTIDFGTQVPVATPAAGGQPTLLFLGPNPFDRSTVLRYRPHGARTMTLDVLDVRGRRVRRLQLPPGPSASTRQFVFDGNDQSHKPLADGIYFFRLRDRPNTPVLRGLLLR